MKWKRGRMSCPLWETHAGNSRLSERDAPGVLECRPGLEWVAPVDSVVQQQPLQKKHVIHSDYGHPTTPDRREWFQSFPSRTHQSRDSRIPGNGNVYKRRV